MNIKSMAIGTAMLAASAFAASPEAAAQEDYIGEIKLVPYTFCPRGTAAADGQLMAISQYSALFSLYGTNFGGDGRTTFGLPDMRGRVPMHQGQGPGLSEYRIGQKGGRETVMLTTPELPAHSHKAGVQVSGEDANSNTPEGNAFANVEEEAYVTGTLPNGTYMNSGTITVDNTGGSQAHPNMQPYIALQYCVVLEGLYPSRN